MIRFVGGASSAALLLAVLASGDGAASLAALELGGRPERKERPWRQGGGARRLQRAYKRRYR